MQKTSSSLAPKQWKPTKSVGETCGFFPRDSLAIPIPCAHASALPPYPACARGACAPSPPAHSPYFILARTQILSTPIFTPSIYLWVPDFPRSLIHEEIVQIPLLPAIVDKSTPIHQRNRPNPSTTQLQFDKSILNPSSPSKESYPSSAQEGSGGQIRPPVELQEPAVLQSLVFLPPLKLQSSILRPSVVVLQEQSLL
jgi:hypothetical protein